MYKDRFEINMYSYETNMRQIIQNYYQWDSLYSELEAEIQFYTRSPSLSR